MVRLSDPHRIFTIKTSPDHKIAKAEYKGEKY
jgi:hypothetical protein